MLKTLLGFFRRRAESLSPASADAKPPEPTVPTLKERVKKMRTIEVGQGGFNLAIVGESHYQDILRRMKGNAFITVGDAPIATFLVAREPDNRYDANAIAVLTEDGDVVGYLDRTDALKLQPTALEHEQRDEVLTCSGKLLGDELIGVWLNLPALTEDRREPTRPVESLPEYDNLDVCRDVTNVGALIEGRKPYSRSRPNWTGNRIAAIGEERYTANLTRASKGRCEEGERINLKVFLVPDTANPIDPNSVMVTTVRGDMLGYLAKAHAIRWGKGIQAFFKSDRVVCRQAGLHQRTFKSGKRTFYLTIDMTDEDWLDRAASR